LKTFVLFVYFVVQLPNLGLKIWATPKDPRKSEKGVVLDFTIVNGVVRRPSRVVR
jgi:hypothetical protein